MWVLSMALAFGDHATADGVAKNLPVFGYTTVAVLDPAAHRQGVYLPEERMTHAPGLCESSARHRFQFLE